MFLGPMRSILRNPSMRLASVRSVPMQACRAFAGREIPGFPMPKSECLKDTTSACSASAGDVPPLWLQTFNDRMMKDIKVTIPLFLVVRNGTWYGLAFLYNKFFSFGPEFAVAYLLVKLTGKFRRPVDIALAALLSKMFPILSQVKVSALFSPPQDKSVKDTAMGKVMTWVQGPMDKYGFSFYLACKLTSFASIAGTAVAIKYGFDISSTLTYFGVSEVIQDASAAFGVATLTNIALIPVHFALVSAMAPAAGKIVEDIRNRK